jgi:hypothetical protein
MVLQDRRWMRFLLTPLEYVSSQIDVTMLHAYVFLLSYIQVGKYSGSVIHCVLMKT